MTKTKNIPLAAILLPALALVFAVALAPAALAATVTVKIEGTVHDGVNGSKKNGLFPGVDGPFGSPGEDLAGKHFVLEFSFSDGMGTGIQNGDCSIGGHPIVYSTGIVGPTSSNPSGTAQLTINGGTWAFDLANSAPDSTTSFRAWWTASRCGGPVTLAVFQVLLSYGPSGTKGAGAVRATLYNMATSLSPSKVWSACLPTSRVQGTSVSFDIATVNWPAAAQGTAPPSNASGQLMPQNITVTNSNGCAGN